MIQTHQSDPLQEEFLRKYGSEFGSVPPYMRARVAYLIDQKVEKQVKEQMDEFKQEVWQELQDQREVSQAAITQY